MTPADRATLLHAAALIEAHAEVFFDRHFDRLSEGTGKIFDREESIIYEDLCSTAKRLRKIAERKRA